MPNGTFRGVPSPLAFRGPPRARRAMWARLLLLFGALSSSASSTCRTCQPAFWHPLTTSVDYDATAAAAAAATTATATTADLVVVHCARDLGWLAHAVSSARAQCLLEIRRVHVYSKCGARPNITRAALPAFVEVISLHESPNVGRCDHAYAAHLAGGPARGIGTTPPAPTDLLLFAKDSSNANWYGKQNVGWCEQANVAHARGFACGRRNEHTWHVARALALFERPFYRVEWDQARGKAQSSNKAAAAAQAKQRKREFRRFRR